MTVIGRTGQAAATERAPGTTERPDGARRRAPGRGWATGLGLGLALVALAGPAAPGAGAAKAPKRVVTLTPFTSNVTARLGVRPVAIGAGNNNIPLVSSLRGVRRLKLSHPTGPNLETLIRLKPDLVLSSANWRTGSPLMRRQRIPVVDNLEPFRVQHVSPAVRRIAARLGRSSASANKLIQQIDARIRASKKGIRSRPSVLLVLGVGRNTVAFLPNSWGGDLIAQAGGRLLTQGMKPTFSAGTPGSFSPISDEEVLRRNPDVIIVVPHGNQSSIPSTVRFFRNKPGWKPTKAARNKRIYIADPDRLLQASEDPGGTIAWVRRSFLRN
jgi:iron complex transport system substrate-binding protein